MQRFAESGNESASRRLTLDESGVILRFVGAAWHLSARAHPQAETRVVAHRAAIARFLVSGSTLRSHAMFCA